LPQAGTRSIFRTLNIRLITAIVLLSVSVSAEQYHYSATNLWTVDFAGHSLSSPALDPSGVIYVTDLHGQLSAINPDGSRRWVFASGFESVSTPAVSGGSILFGSRNHRLYSVDTAGRKKWDFKTGGWVDASPAVAPDGTVYVGSWDKKLYAIAVDGQKRWEFATGGPVTSSAALDAAGNVYFGSHDRKFYALNPDGSKRWEFATGASITSSPALGGEGEIYFASVDGRFYVLNPDGKRRWDLQTGGITSSSPVIGTDGTIFISVNQTHCAIAPDGKLKWQRAFWNARPGYFGETAAGVLADNSVIFTGGDGYAMTVPADNGDKEWWWNYWLSGPSYSSPLVAPNGTVYVVGLVGQLNALQRSVPPANSPWSTFRGNPQRTGRIAVAR
jgi:outer membrane protein assembly factor BamB